MEDYPSSVTKKCHEIILKQMNKSFGIINEKEIVIFIHINYENKDIYAILINNYINNEEYKDIKDIEINNKIEKIELEEIIYKNKEENISIIKLKQKNKKINYIEIEDKLDEEYYKKESIYIIQYNNINNILISYGLIKEIDNNKLIYTGNINSKYKFIPIFNLSNNKLIGIHNNNDNKHFKKGINLKRNINEFIKRVKYPNNIQYKYEYNYYNINEIDILIKIKKEDINKEIYFVKHNNNNLKELNELNTELNINNNNYEYKKYFIPDKEGDYKINIKFNIDLKDCSYMFAGCENIIDINFISFNTKSVTNMSEMFSDCSSLNNLEGISKWDTVFCLSFIK